jgi:hypothetical protein
MSVYFLFYLANAVASEGSVPVIYRLILCSILLSSAKALLSSCQTSSNSTVLCRVSTYPTRYITYMIHGAPVPLLL